MTPRRVRFTTTAQEAGTSYLYADILGVRRIYLRKVACHIYYTFDEHEVIVRALWGARRGKGPVIEP